jgi:uncharacterized protein (DUF1499 family)
MVKKNWLNWAAYGVLLLGALCLLLTTIGAMGNRTGLLHFRTALNLFLSAGKIALPVTGIALLILILTILKKASRIVTASAAIGLILAVGIYIPYYIFTDRAQTLPRIHDITTDTEQPPVFVKVASNRAAGLNSLEYGGPKIAQQQMAAYPQVKAAHLSIDKSAAFRKTLEVVKELDWEVVDANQAEGRIEATDTTFFYGFKDDVVIRITKEGPQKSRIDIRSVSRVGVSDVGVNAERIMKFLNKLQ